MRLYLHGLTTEAHRSIARGADLAAALARRGVEVTLRLRSDVDWALCGTFEDYPDFETAASRDAAHRASRRLGRRVRVVYFCWDLYPAQVRGRPDHDRDRREMWARYPKVLSDADLVLTPSGAARKRVLELTDQRPDRVRVVLSSCDPWYGDYPREQVHDWGYVLQVVRPYPWDPNNDALRDACARLGIGFRSTEGELPWDQFKDAVAGARLLCCPYVEASTGGLALLEGYALGKPVLIPDSPYNGAGEYLPFGRPGVYGFRPDEPGQLDRVLKSAWEAEAHAGSFPAGRARAWVAETYSDDAFAGRLVRALREAG